MGRAQPRDLPAALADPGDHANDPSYKPLFERAVRGFEEWLGSQGS